MDPEAVDAPSQPSATSSLQETPQPSVATRYQGVRYETLPPLSTGKECLYLRGVPYDAKPETIMEFLGEDAHSVVDQGVHIVYTPEGQPSGEAIIQMNSEDAAFWACSNSHSRYMMGQKPSIIEALLCSVDEMKTMLAGSQPGPVPFSPSGAGEPQPGLNDAINPGQPQVPTWQPAAMAAPSPTCLPPGMPWSPPMVSPGACSPDKATVTMLLVRDLPESATENDIMTFFNSFPGLQADAVYMRHLADPRMKGSAFVAVPCHAGAVRAVLDRQCHYIANRKVELCIVDTDSVLRWLRAPSRAHLYNVPAPPPPAGK